MAGARRRKRADGRLQWRAGDTTSGSAATAAPAPATRVPLAATSQPGATLAAASTPSAPVTAGGTPGSQPEPKLGGTLRTAVVGDTTISLDPHFLGPGNLSVTWLAFDRLLSYDDTLQPQPELAESWDLSPDSTQLTLKLRQGVTFHSGRPFTSDDVAYNLQRVRDPKVALQLATMAAWITSVETPDATSVVIHLDQSRPTILDLFEWMCIVDKVSMEGPNAKTSSIGTGPYVFDEWQQGDHFQYTRNKSYWRVGRPYLDGVVVHVLSDPQAMAVQLEAGALDSVTGASLVDQARMATDPNYVLVSTAGPGYYALTLNVTSPPTDNPAVREALNYALDRQRFVQTVLKGIGQPIELPWPAYSPAYDASRNTAHPFDLDKARSILEGAGVSGLEMDFTFGAGSQEFAQLAQMYQQDLAKIGVSMNIKQVDPAVALDAMQKLTYTGVAAVGSTFAQLQPGTLFLSARLWNYMANQTGYKSDQYAQLVQQSVTEPDPAKRKATYSQLNDLILSSNAWLIVATNPATAISHANVHGIRLDLGGARLLTDTWLG